MRRFFEIGGVVAAAILIAFGITAIVMGVSGRNTVHKSLKQEQIVGTPDMTPAAIAAEAKKAGLPSSIDLPTVSVAGKRINNGDRARAFASYMAEQISLFGIAMGIALLLAGIGFGILAIGGALRNPDTALSFPQRKALKRAPIST